MLARTATETAERSVYTGILPRDEGCTAIHPGKVSQEKTRGPLGHFESQILWNEERDVVSSAADLAAPLRSWHASHPFSERGGDSFISLS